MVYKLILIKLQQLLMNNFTSISTNTISGVHFSQNHRITNTNTQTNKQSRLHLTEIKFDT